MRRKRHEITMKLYHSMANFKYQLYYVDKLTICHMDIAFPVQIMIKAVTCHMD